MNKIIYTCFVIILILVLGYLGYYYQNKLYLYMMCAVSAIYILFHLIQKEKK